MGKSSSHGSTAKAPATVPRKAKAILEKPAPTFAPSGHAGRSLLFVFGGMLLGLITAGFLVIALMLPIQIGSRLDAEFSKEIIPLFSTGFEQFNNEIKIRLEKQMGASVQQVEKAFESENKSKAAFLAKSLLPLIEGFDMDGVAARVKQYLSENDSVKGIRYRTDAKGNWTTVGTVSGGDLRMFQSVEKTKFAHAEIELHVSPAGLEEARKRQGGVFQEILSATESAKNGLVQNATHRTN